MKIRNPKYPFKQCGPWENCPTCFEDFSLTPCTNCGSGFEDEYIEMPSELEQLTNRIAELEAEVERLSAAHVKACQANADLQVEFAKAEQRVAEAIGQLCDEQEATYSKDIRTGDLYKATACEFVAKRVRAGQWRKFVKEV